MTHTNIKALLWDIGNVFVHWSPVHLYIKHGYSQDEAERIARDVVPLEWHGRADLGLSIAENVRQRIEERTADRRALELYRDDWLGTVAGEIAGSTALLKACRAAGLPCYGLSNFPADQFGLFLEAYPAVKNLMDVVVSGEVGLMKPDPRIYALAIDRFGLTPGETLFIDDRADNCAAAEDLGFQTHQFTDADALKAAFEAYGLPT